LASVFFSSFFISFLASAFFSSFLASAFFSSFLASVFFYSFFISSAYVTPAANIEATSSASSFFIFCFREKLI